MSARSLALVGILLTSGGLAGCIQGLNEPVTSAAIPDPRDLLDLGEVLDVRITLPDGLTSHGTVYLPDVPEGTKVPVIMDLGPYYGNLRADSNAYSEEHPPNMLYEHFLRRGYAVALVSLRGTGQSEGCFKIGGAEEQQDATAIVEWLASQAWSNGNVGMTGVSYDGTTPWEAAVTGTPALKAIVPVAGISDMYRYSFFEGVPIGGGHFFNTYYTALVDWAYLDPQGLTSWAAVQGTNPCPETVQVIKQGYDTYLDGVHGPYWDERDTSAMMDNVQAATFVVHGLQDWNVKPDHVQTLWDDLPEPKRMLLGQWEHNIPWRNTYNEDWSYAAYNATVEQWFDAFLKEDEAARTLALAAPPVLAQDSSGKWWNLTGWPPEETVETPLFFAPGGELGRAQPGEAREFRFRADVTGADPAPDVPTRVAFSSPTLKAPLALMGNPRADLTVSVDRPGGYLAVALYDVDADGTKRWVAPGYLNLANRESRDRQDAVPVDTPMDVTVPMYATAHVFQPGHRLVLEVSSHDPSMSPVNKHVGTTFTLHVGPDAQGAFHAPVFRGDVPGSGDAEAAKGADRSISLS